MGRYDDFDVSVITYQDSHMEFDGVKKKEKDLEFWFMRFMCVLWILMGAAAVAYLYKVWIDRAGMWALWGSLLVVGGSALVLGTIASFIIHDERRTKNKRTNYLGRAHAD